MKVAWLFQFFFLRQVEDEVVALRSKVARIAVEDNAKGQRRVEAALILRQAFSLPMLHEAPCLVKFF